MDNRYYDNLQRVNPGYGKPRFSRREVRDIVIAVVVLALAFTILYRNSNFLLGFFQYHLGNEMKYVGLFGLSVVLVVVSFLFHEFGHKFVAQKFGLWSEFRMWPAGLALTLITSLFGFLFASPGAVVISGNVDKDRNGKISIAGPVVNMVLAAIGVIGCVFVNGTPWVILFYLLGSLNAFLALFNMLPIPPLDGSKILPWRVEVWIAGIAIAGIEVYAMMFGLGNLYYYL